MASHGIDRTGAAGGTGTASLIGAFAELADPNADRIVMWDDSADGFAWLTVAGSNLTLTGTSLALSGTLADIGSLTPTDSNIIVGNGTTWVAESGATARTSLGLGTLAVENDPLPVNKGGTGAATFTDAGVLIGNSSNAIQVTSAGTLGQALKSNGPGIDPTFQSTDPTVQIFTANGTYIRPAGLRVAICEVVGGGGGSGGNAATGAAQGSAGGGGGGSGYGRLLLTAAALGASQAVTIGAGGLAGAAGAGGGTGGTTSLGALISATGGSGGAPGTASGGSQPDGAGGVGGSATGGNFNATGNAGGMGHVTIGVAFNAGGFGGGSFFGGGAVSAKTTTKQSGLAGSLFGGGASGASAGESQTAGGGAVGAAGILIVTEFY